MSQSSEHKKCPFCLGDIEEDQAYVRCPQCGVIHHAECWKENGKCSAYGCDGSVIWNEAISAHVSPQIVGRIEVSSTDLQTQPREKQKCMECGREVKPGQLVCSACRSGCIIPVTLICCSIFGFIAFLVKAVV